MRYKVTAHQHISILANVPNNPDGEGKIARQSETLMWLTLAANQSQDGLGRIVGIDPRCVQQTNTVTEGHFTYVPIKCAEEDYCKTHFRLFRIERSNMPD